MVLLIESRRRVVVAGKSYDAVDVESTLNEIGESVSSSEGISDPEVQNKLLNLKTPFGKLFSKILESRTEIDAKADLASKFERLDVSLTPGNLASAKERKRLLQNVASLEASLSSYKRDLSDLNALWTEKFSTSTQKDPFAEVRKMDTKQCDALGANLRSIKVFIMACDQNPPILGKDNTLMWPENSLKQMQSDVSDIRAKLVTVNELAGEREQMAKKMIEDLQK